MTTNNDKILKVLETKRELITTTELSNETSIDIRNITRYLKPLENKGLIVRKTIQNGKLRVVMIGLSKEKPHPPIAPPKPIQKKDLKPPKQVEPTSFVNQIINEEDIDFNKIANSSEFKRFIFMIRTGSTFRGSNEELDKKLVKTEQEISIVRELGRGSHQDFREVVNELKEI